MDHDVIRQCEGIIYKVGFSKNNMGDNPIKRGVANRIYGWGGKQRGRALDSGNPEDRESNAVENLTEADNCIRHYSPQLAFTYLKQASEYEGATMPADQLWSLPHKDKITGYIITRAYRLLKKIESLENPTQTDLKYAKKTRELIEEIEQARKIRPGKLEKSALTAAAAIMGIAGGIFLLVPSITGNVISNMTNTSSNILGAALLVMGLVASFAWLKDRKK